MKKTNSKNRILVSAIIIIILVVISSLLAGIFFIVEKISDVSLPEGKKSGLVAVIPITGVITTVPEQGFGSAVITSDQIIESLDEAEKNSNVKAIILEINSGGGSGVAADEISQKIKSIDKPVIAVIRDMGTSAAYWIASSTDYVFANRLSITGSIGVIGSYLDFSGLMHEYNVTYQRYVSGEFKDMGSPFKEASEAEEDLFQDMINQMQLFLIAEVSENRGIEIENIDTSGKIYLGSEAKDAGLIDELGTKADAFFYIENTYNITATEIKYSQKKTFADLLSELSYSNTKIGKFINPVITNYFQLG